MRFLDEDRIARPGAVAVFYTAILCVVFFPYLFQDRIALNSADAVLAYYPQFEFYGDALKRGDSFLWNPYIFSGFPTYVSQSAGFLDPLNILLFKIFEPLTAYHARLFVDSVLVVLFSFLAARALGLSRLASALVGPSYLLAFNWLFLFNPVIANTLFLLPFLIFVFLKALHAPPLRRALWAAAGGAAVGWSFIAGYAQPTIYALTILGLCAFIQWAWVDDERRTRRLGARIIVIVCIVGVLGSLAGLPQILPALEFAAFTERESGVSWAEANQKALTLGDLVYFVFPDYIRFTAYLTYGRMPLYVGGFWFLLACIGFVFALRRRAMASVAALFAFCFIAALKWSPAAFVLHQLPVFDYFRFPRRWMYWGAWFLAVLGAYGFDSLREYADGRGREKLARIVAAFAVVVAAGVIALNVFGDALARIGVSALPGRWGVIASRAISELAGSLSLADAAFLVPFAALMLGAAFIYGYIREKISWERFRLAGAVLVVAAFVGIFAVQWRWSAPADQFVGRHGAILERVLPQEDRALYRAFPFKLGYPYRNVFGGGVSDFNRVLYDKENLRTVNEMQFSAGLPNTNMFSGIASVDGYDVFVPSVMREVLIMIGSTATGEEQLSGSDDAAKRQALLENLDVLGMMAGKYVVSGMPLAHAELQLIAEERISGRGLPLYIYENAEALPRWYFAERTAEAMGDSTIALVKSGRRDFKKTAYLDCVGCAGGGGRGGAHIRAAAVRNADAVFEVETEQPRWFIFSESFLPGWSATIDGVSTPIVRANGLYMALAVPAGTHWVGFSYDGMRGEAVSLRAFKIIRDN